MRKIEQLLNEVYDTNKVEYIKEEIKKLWKKYSFLKENKVEKLTQKDVVLITYGDQVYKKGENKLKTLHNLLNKYLKEEINIVHILPFYPYTSDDGFSVSDYYNVEPKLGTWDDIEQLSIDYTLMFDAVINHCSVSSKWFKGFLSGKGKYKDYFINEDLSKGYDNVVRPRTSPLSHTFEYKGKKFEIQTTFSKDQADLNYKNPELFLQILDLLLFYMQKGAFILRLDAIGFIWKEENTTCIHLPQVHSLVKLMRLVTQHINPSVMLLTETNVPHIDNISYFGKGDEAHMVYNFTLPPLLAYSLLSENTKKFNEWISNLSVPYDNVCYFNFLSSHDGIGVMPVQEILNEKELGLLVSSAKANGGKVSYKSIANGKKVIYEINCNFLSLLHGKNKDERTAIMRSILSHAVLLSLPGLPAIYFHSIFGSKNDIAGMTKTGLNRRINREKFNFDYFNDLLDKPETRQKLILNEIKNLIKIRKKESAFNPYGKFTVNSSENGIFFITRKSSKKNNTISCYFNFTQQEKNIALNETKTYTDIISFNTFKCILKLKPLSFVWLKETC